MDVDLETRCYTGAQLCRGSCGRGAGCRSECPLGPEATLMRRPIYKLLVEKEGFGHDTDCEEGISSQYPPPPRSVAAWVSGATTVATADVGSFTIGAQRGAAPSASQQLEDVIRTDIYGTDRADRMNIVGGLVEDLHEEVRSSSPSSDMGDAMQRLLYNRTDERKQSSSRDAEVNKDNSRRQSTADAAKILLQMGRGSGRTAAIQSPSADRVGWPRPPPASIVDTVGIHRSVGYDAAIARKTADRLQTQSMNTVNASTERARFFRQDNSDCVDRKARVRSSTEIGRIDNRDDLASHRSGSPEDFADDAAVGSHTWTDQQDLLYGADRIVENTALLSKSSAAATEARMVDVQVGPIKNHITPRRNSYADLHDPGERLRTHISGINDDWTERHDMSEVQHRQPPRHNLSTTEQERQHVRHAAKYSDNEFACTNRPNEISDRQYLPVFCEERAGYGSQTSAYRVVDRSGYGHPPTDTARVQNVDKGRGPRAIEYGQAYSPVEGQTSHSQRKNMFADIERPDDSSRLSDRQPQHGRGIEDSHTTRYANGNQQNEQNKSSADDRRPNREMNHRDAAGGGYPPDGSDGDDGSDDHRRKPSRRIDSRRDLSPRRSRRRSSSPDLVSSDDNYHYRSRRWMKPEKFDGHSSFETFIYMFENCCKYNKWGEEDKVAHLRWSLTGIAAQLLWDTEHLSYSDLMEKLRNRFGGKGMEEKFQTELRCRRRNKGESIREMAQDIRRLMSLAYPGEKSGLAEHIARDAFLVALDDQEMELKIREREPVDLDSAVRLALRLEVFQSATEARGYTRSRSNRHVEDYEVNEGCTDNLRVRLTNLEEGLKQLRSQASTPTVQQNITRDKQPAGLRQKTPSQKNGRAVSTENHVQWKDDLLSRIKELEAERAAALNEATQAASQNEVMSKEIDRLRHLEQIRSSSQPTANVVQQQSDFRPQSFRQSAAGRAPGTCWTCGQTGHYSRVCPGRNAGRNEQQPPKQNSAVTRTEGVGNKRQRRNAHAAYLHATVGSTDCKCLLDSGSEISVLPAEIVPADMITRTTHTLKAANGTPISVSGQATLPLTVGTFKTTVTGVVSAHVTEVMLGIEWLTDNQVVWHFGQQRIQIGDDFYPVHIRQSRDTWCRRVVLQEDVMIPARVETNMSTKVIFRGSLADQSDPQWGTETKSLAPGLRVARTIVPNDRVNDIPIRVVNTSPEAITLKAGTTISNLVPLEIVERMAGDVSTSTTTPPAVETSRTIEEMISHVHESLPGSSVIKLKEVLTEYNDIFSQSEDDLGLTNVITHQIDTGTAVPIRQQLRRFPPAHVEAISQHVDTMMSQGVIEPASSPWASNLVLVRKKDGTFRCCVDYRRLNSVTRKDAYPLPRIDSCLDAMAMAKWFSTFDLRSSYHQVRVDPQDRDKTAFICPRGMYRFRAMPFGLCNAGATFQRLMDVVMAGLHLDICLVYLDDIIVYSRTPEEHFERLNTVFNRLRQSGLKLKPEKCCLFQKSVSFLGHVISEDGIGTDPKKTQAVVDWPVPTCQKDVRAFLGLAGYYRRFIRDFAKKAVPLHNILKKGSTFTWSNEAQQAFDEIKLLLTTPPILAMPTDNDEFVLDTDASDTAIGAVLSQRQGGIERVVAYASKSLCKRERNYCVTRKELLAIVHFLKYFKQYLLGRQFRIRTDHAALTWLRHTPDPIGQQARWLEQLEEFHFAVEHRPGTRHGNADAMSRHPCSRRECRCHQESTIVDNAERVRHITAVTGSQLRHAEETEVKQFRATSLIGPADRLATVTVHSTNIDETDQSDGNDTTVLPWSWNGLQEAQREDPDIAVIIRLMEASPEKPNWEAIASHSKDVKTLWHMWPRLSIRQGLLKRRFEALDGLSEKWQIVWPKKLREEFLEIAHTGMTGGHMSRRKTAASVQSRAYWPSWSSDLDGFLKKCVPCARYHRGAAPHHAYLQTPQVGEPWERVSVDITGPHPRSSRSNQYILTLVDHFSKWAEAIPLSNHTAPTVARALVMHVFSRYGAPRQLLTDKGPEFESDLFAEVMKWLEIDKLRTTAYKPSTNGAVERFHRTLNSMLGKVVSESQRDWDERLPFVLAAYRASPHGSTGFSPNMLFLGRETRMPLDLIMGLPTEEAGPPRSMHDFVVQMREKAETAYEIAREKLRISADRRKASYDIRVRELKYNVGDWVWYHYPRKYRSKSPKWQKNYAGPYLVVRVIEPVNYVIRRSARAKPFVVHGDKLKRCFSSTPASWLDRDDSDSTVHVPTANMEADPEIVDNQNVADVRDHGDNQADSRDLAPNTNIAALPRRSRRRTTHRDDHV